MLEREHVLIRIVDVTAVMAFVGVWTSGMLRIGVGPREEIGVEVAKPLRIDFVLFRVSPEGHWLYLDHRRSLPDGCALEEFLAIDCSAVGVDLDHGAGEIRARNGPMHMLVYASSLGFSETSFEICRFIFRARSARTACFFASG